MNREKYLEMRAAMLEEAQNLINQGKMKKQQKKEKKLRS